jgi:hypothetical protein
MCHAHIIKFSIELDLLLSLIELGQFTPAVDSIEKLNDTHIQTWLDKNREAKTDSLPFSRLYALVSKFLPIRMNEKDVAQRIVTLFADYTTWLRTHGLSWVIKEKPKVAVRHIIDALCPFPLQKRIRVDLEFSQSHLRKQWLPFKEHVSKRAEQYDEFDDQRVTTPTAVRDRSSLEPGTGQNVGPHGTPSKHNKGGSSPTSRASKDKNKGHSPTAKKAPVFLNPECGGLPLLKECMSTSQERKDEIFQDRAAARKAAGDQRSTRTDSYKIAAQMPTTSRAVRLALQGEGRLEALFHSSITRVSLPDLGADDNVIPASPISELEAAGMFVPQRTLAAPITVDLAVQGPGLSTLVTRQAMLTMELQLPAGPLRLRNVKWLVAENDMDKVL